MADQLFIVRVLTNPCRTKNVRQLKSARFMSAVSACALAGGMLLLTGCGGAMNGSSGGSSSTDTPTPVSTAQCAHNPGLASQDLAGQCRSAPTTMGALEVGAESTSATSSVAAGGTAQAASSRQLEIAWRPMGNDTAGYMVYAGNTAETANILVSDLSITSGQMNPESPAVTYDSARDLGLYAGDSVCFRIHAYDMVRALSSDSTVVCTTV